MDIIVGLIVLAFCIGLMFFIDQYDTDIVCATILFFPFVIIIKAVRGIKKIWRDSRNPANWNDDEKEDEFKECGDDDLK